MKSSMLLVAASAALGLAGAINRRDYVTEIEIVYKTVTVTEGDIPAATSTPAYVIQGGKHRTRPVEPTTTSTPEPETSTYVVVEPTPDPTPEYTEAPTPTPEPTTEVVVESPTYEDKPVAASPTADTSYSAPSDLISASLYHHNIHRANHSSPDVTWSDELASYAATSALKCDMNHDLSPGGGGYGQNLAAWGTSGSVDDVTDEVGVGSATSNMWYGEYPSYADYFGTEPGGSFEAWGHLTQVLWAGTKEIGCKVQKCPKGTMYGDFNAVYIVCNYRPAGNIGGAYASNVKKPLGYPTVKGG